jgi:hypothetical protein
MAEKKEKETCFACGFYVFCEIHHIVPIQSGGMDVPHNLVPLCSGCHHLLTHGFAEVSNMLLIMKGLLGEGSQVNREQRLYTLLLMQLMADWVINPEKAHDSCNKIMWDYLNPEVASLKQGYHPDIPVPYGYKRVGRHLSQVPSEQAIVTKIRELRKKWVTDKKILESLTKLGK